MQPYYIPWYGFLEQLKLADYFVFYDDVQYVKRTLMNRVSVKDENSSLWMTIPLNKVHQGQNINVTKIQDISDWKEKHNERLKNAYNTTEFFDDFTIVCNEIYSHTSLILSEFTINAIKEIAAYYSFNNSTDYFLSSDLNIEGKSSERLIAICKELGATTYITGFGALNYLDFELFEQNDITVEFMNYSKKPYPQINGEFNPFVTSLDLIANTGPNGVRYMTTKTMHWKDFIKTEAAFKYLGKQ